MIIKESNSFGRVCIARVTNSRWRKQSIYFLVWSAWWATSCLYHLKGAVQVVASGP